MGLECKFYRKLNIPWVASPLYAAKIAAVRDISVWIQELRVVKDVEDLRPQLNGIALLNRKSLLDTKVHLPHIRGANQPVAGVEQEAAVGAGNRLNDRA